MSSSSAGLPTPEGPGSVFGAPHQDWPDRLLPEELRRDNPLGVPRRIEA